MLEAIWEAVSDSLIALPVLVVIYTLIEFMEHKGGVKFEKMVASSKKTGPLWGAGIGCIPQCGFSAIMADLYSKRMITIGTLFAVFIATSDEALAILMQNPKQNILSLLALIGCKLVLAIIFGYVFDLIFKKENKKLVADNLEHSTHHDHEHTHSHDEKAEENCETCKIEEVSCDACGHNHLHHSHELENEDGANKKKVIWHIILQGLIHALIIFGIILATNLVIQIVLELAGGEEVLATILGKNAWYQPFICALIGLIPNCAGSVVLTELYLSGLLSFASCLGGLCTGAGVGLIILFKNKKDIKHNLFIVLMLYMVGAIIGLIFNLFMPFNLL